MHQNKGHGDWTAHTYTHTDGWPVLDVLFGWSLDGAVSVRLFLIRLVTCWQFSGSQIQLFFNHLLLYYSSFPILFKRKASGGINVRQYDVLAKHTDVEKYHKLYINCPILTTSTLTVLNKLLLLMQHYEQWPCTDQMTEVFLFLHWCYFSALICLPPFLPISPHSLLSLFWRYEPQASWHWVHISGWVNQVPCLQKALIQGCMLQTAPLAWTTRLKVEGTFCLAGLCQ